MIAEFDGALLGVARFGLVPCPPIYHAAGSMAFVLFDDVALAIGARPSALPALIEAAEREGAAANTAVYLASAAPFQRAKRDALANAGYSAVTQYLVKHGLARRDGWHRAVRPATAADVPNLVAMGAASQRELAAANATMWTPHPDAPARFGLWMQYALTLADRRIFISTVGPNDGFIIAQPPSAFHLPLTSQTDHIGLIDDFWAAEFAASGAASTSSAADLLATAEQEAAGRGRSTTMVICPAAWPAKQAFLRAHGYGDGNDWFLKAR